MAEELLRFGANGGVRDFGRDTQALRDPVLKVFNPYALSPDANTAGLSLREHAAQAAQTFARAEEALKLARKLFTTRPWRQNPDFINRMEVGDRQADAGMQAIADTCASCWTRNPEASFNSGPGAPGALAWTNLLLGRIPFLPLLSESYRIWDVWPLPASSTRRRLIRQHGLQGCSN